MTSEYSRGILRLVVAQICQTVGWHSINSTPLEFMVDLVQEYLLRVSKLTHQYAEVLGRTEANLDDLGLAFRHMNIDIQELAEYVRNVDSVPCAVDVPKFPVHRDNHLNFLKPGSREVVTRSVHVHEHLPAMYPETEEEYASDNRGIDGLTNGTASDALASMNGVTSAAVAPATDGSADASSQRGSPQGVFKRPGDPVSFDSPIAKRARVAEESRPLREIHSVMMTTSGFLSPAREGKLPEARTPQQARSDSPPPSSYPMVPPELKCEKKPKKVVKKVGGGGGGGGGGPEDRKLDKENKKKNRAKELFKPDKIDDSKVKKLTGMKETAKLKALKPGGGKTQNAAAAGPSSRPATPKLVTPKSTGSPKPSKAAQPKVKPEKVVDLTDSPPRGGFERKEDHVDKLPSEPDKQKLNIFKKISKPREDKEKETQAAEMQEQQQQQRKYKDLDSRESSPGLIIDENNDARNAAHRNNDAEARREEKRTAHTPDVHVPPDGDSVGLQSPSSDVYMFDDMSPPGTPSTPKTPELNVPTLVDQKRKRKEKTNRKKESKLKSPKRCVSPKKAKVVSNDLAEPDVLDRPKTPQAPEPPPQHKEPSLPPALPFPFFPTFPTAPGLIPHPIGHPMFSRFPLPLGRGGPPGPHPAMPNLPLPPRFIGPAPKPEDFAPAKVKSAERERSTPAALPTTTAPPLVKSDKPEKEKPEKIGKVVKQDKDASVHNSAPAVVPPQPPPPVAPAPAAPVVTPSPAPNATLPKNAKVEKPDKNDKKSKEHKKEKKDKLKKKKDKKEKHKEKGEKVKEKKEKGEKKEKAEKVKEKKERKEKRKEKDKEEKVAEGVPKITLKLGPASPRPPTPDTAPMKKITIKPLVKKPEEDAKREPSPELAKISALVTRPPKQKSAKVKADAVAKKDDAKEDKENGVNPLVNDPTAIVDESGRQVWICPACGSQDDGSPMIGCDDCDAWYHWVCVGMQVPPATNEDWYCRSCIAKKQELHHDKKKKKRKKKVKVTA